MSHLPSSLKIAALAAGWVVLSSIGAHAKVPLSEYFCAKLQIDSNKNYLYQIIESDYDTVFLQKKLRKYKIDDGSIVSTKRIPKSNKLDYRDIVLSDDGTKMLVAYYNNIFNFFVLYDTETMEQIAKTRLRTIGYQIAGNWGFAFIPNSDTIAIAIEDDRLVGRILLWDYKSGKKKRIIMDIDPRFVVADPKGTHIVTSDGAEGLRIRLADKKIKSRFLVGINSGYWNAIRNNYMIYNGYSRWGGPYYVNNITTGDRVARIETDHQDPDYGERYGDANKTALSVMYSHRQSGDRLIRVFDIQTGQIKNEIKFQYSSESLLSSIFDMSGSGKYLAVCPVRADDAPMLLERDTGNVIWPTRIN